MRRRVEPADEGVQRVGIEDERRGGLFENGGEHGAEVGVLAQSGAEGGDAVTTYKIQQLRQGGGAQPAAIVLGQRSGHVAGIGGDEREDAIGHRQPHQAGAAAQRRAGAQHRRSGHAATAGHDQDAAERALVGV